MSALWALGHITLTLQGTQNLLVSPPGSSPSCPFIPPPMLTRAQPPSMASQTQRAEGTGLRIAHQTAHSMAEDTEALVLHPESSATAPQLLPWGLGWVSRPQVFFL